MRLKGLTGDLIDLKRKTGYDPASYEDNKTMSYMVVLRRRFQQSMAAAKSRKAR